MLHDNIEDFESLLQSATNISKVEWNATTKKWTIIYKSNLTPDVFDSITELKTFLWVDSLG